MPTFLWALKFMRLIVQWPECFILSLKSASWMLCRLAEEFLAIARLFSSCLVNILWSQSLLMRTCAAFFAACTPPAPSPRLFQVLMSGSQHSGYSFYQHQSHGKKGKLFQGRTVLYHIVKHVHGCWLHLFRVLFSVSCFSMSLHLTQCLRSPESGASDERSQILRMFQSLRCNISFQLNR